METTSIHVETTKQKQGRLPFILLGTNVPISPVESTKTLKRKAADKFKPSKSKSIKFDEYCGDYEDQNEVSSSCETESVKLAKTTQTPLTKSVPKPLVKEASFLHKFISSHQEPKVTTTLEVDRCLDDDPSTVPESSIIDVDDHVPVSNCDPVAWTVPAAIPPSGKTCQYPVPSSAFVRLSPVVPAVVPETGTVSSALSSPKTPTFPRTTKVSKAEREQLRMDRLKEREEAARLKELKKEQREKERLEREEVKRVKKVEEDKLRQSKLLVKAELQAKKDEETRIKEQQRLLNEEARKKKEDEKRKMELERQQREADELHKQEEKKRRFSNFFVKRGKVEESAKAQVKDCGTLGGRFQPFVCKENMELAPLMRRDCVNVSIMDRNLSQIVGARDYLVGVKHQRRVVRRDELPLDETSCEVVYPEDQLVYKGKVKILKFHTDNRPPYRGTWRKKLGGLGLRNPFFKHEDLDYDYDSDDDWEPEPTDGDNLDDSDGNGESGSEDEDEDEEETFMVPHGYLSADEMDDGDEGVMDLEAMKVKEQVWLEQKRKMGVVKLQPVCVGLNWTGNNSYLKKYSAIAMTTLPVSTDSLSVKDSVVEAGSLPGTPTSTIRGTTKFAVPDEALPDLVRLLHGHRSSSGKIAREFREALLAKKDRASHVSIAQIKAKIKEMSVYEKRAGYVHSRWFVHHAVLDQFGLRGLVVRTYPGKSSEVQLTIPTSRLSQPSPHEAGLARSLPVRPQTAGPPAEDLVESVAKPPSTLRRQFKVDQLLGMLRSTPAEPPERLKQNVEKPKTNKLPFVPLSG